MEIKTLNEQIERLRELIRKCYGAVFAKGGEVPEVGERNMENLPAAIASTHDTLEELTITQNGTYTPQEGVDGFSKVVANVVTTKKVKIGTCGARFLNDDCINSEGIWEDSDLIDFSECTSMHSMFMHNTSRLKELDVSNWDTSKVTSFAYWYRYGGDIERIIGKLNVSAATEMTEMIWGTKKLEEFDVSDWKFNSNLKRLPAFYQCYSLKMLDVSNWNVENITEFNSAFHSIAYKSEIIIDVSKWDVSNAVSLYGMFGSETGIRVLDFRNWDISNVTNIKGFLGGGGTRYNILESLIGGETIESVLNSNIAALKNLKISLHLADNKLLDRASLRAVINGLADLTGQTAQTLTLGAKLIAKLTEEDIAIAVNKNWTVV